MKFLRKLTLLSVNNGGFALIGCQKQGLMEKAGENRRRWKKNR